MTKQNKKILMVIAQLDFRDEEYFIPKCIFKEAGFEVKTAGLNRGEALGVFGSVVNVDLAINEIKIADYAAVVFAGGKGMAALLDNNNLHNLAKAVVEQDKIIGATCIAPAVLAKAGVLRSKKATVWTSDDDKTAKEILEQEGAYFVDKPVVVDGKIITANRPEASRKFAEEIVKATLSHEGLIFT